MKRAGGSTGFSSAGFDGGGSSSNSNFTNGNNVLSSTSTSEGWYDFLQLPRDATAETVKRTYRQLALLWHPDKGGCVKRFQSLTAAWEVLGNAERRRLYDRQLLRSGSSDGFRYKRRSTWGESTSGGIGAITLREIPVGKPTARDETTQETLNAAGENEKRIFTEWSFLRRRQHSTEAGAVFRPQQQRRQQQGHDQQEQDRNPANFPTTWSKNQNSAVSEASALPGEKVTASSGSRIAHQAAAPASVVSETQKVYQCAGAGIAHTSSNKPGRITQQQPHQEQQEQHHNTRAELSRYERQGKGTEQKKGGGEQIPVRVATHFQPPRRSKSVVEESFLRPEYEPVFQSSVTQKQDATPESDVAPRLPTAAPPRHRHACQPCKGFSHSSTAGAVAFCPSSSSSSSSAFAAAAATRVGANSSAENAAANRGSCEWYSGGRSTHSLADMESALTEVLGEQGLVRKYPSTPASIHEDVQRLGVKQLKQLLSNLSIPYNSCIEKHDLLDAFTEAFPDVLLAQPRGQECRSSSNVELLHADTDTSNEISSIAHGRSRCRNQAEAQRSNSGGTCGNGTILRPVDSAERSDSRSSFSSSDSGVFHKFHSPAAAARATFGKVVGEVEGYAAPVQRADVGERLQFGATAEQSSPTTCAPALPPFSFAAAGSAAASCSATIFSASLADSSFPTYRGTSLPVVYSQMPCQGTQVVPALLHSNMRVKVIVIGEEKVGKSCIIKRYCEGRFVARNAATVALDYGVKIVKVKQNNLMKHNQQEQQLDLQEKREHDEPQKQVKIPALVRVNFFDFSGKREFKEVRKEFYAYTDGVLLVYDVSRRQSFFQLKGWVEEVAQLLQQHKDLQRSSSDRTWPCHNKKELFYIIQTDAPILMLLGNKVDKEREVEATEGEAFARVHGMLFFETSASSGHNVEKALESLFEATTARVITSRNNLASRLGKAASTTCTSNCAATDAKPFTAAVQVPAL